MSDDDTSWYARIGRELAQTIVWIVVLTAISLAFLVTGYASIQGLQALAMLALSTLLMSLALQGLARVLATLAALVIAAGALAVAFVLPANTASTFRLVLVVGAGSWLVVGAILLGADRKSVAPYTWIVGALVWFAISITYASPWTFSRAGALVNYLWIPWATLGFALGQVLVPWWLLHVKPRLPRAVGAWSYSTGKGITMGIAVAALIALLLPLVGGPAAEGATVACAGCADGGDIAGLRVVDGDGGTVLIADLDAPPTFARIHAASGSAIVDLTLTPRGWLVDAPTVSDLLPADVGVEAEGSRLYVLLARESLRGPAAIALADGTRAPPQGYLSPE